MSNSGAYFVWRKDTQPINAGMDLEKAKTLAENYAVDTGDDIFIFQLVGNVALKPHWFLEPKEK